MTTISIDVARGMVERLKRLEKHRLDGFLDHFIYQRGLRRILDLPVELLDSAMKNLEALEKGPINSFGECPHDTDACKECNEWVHNRCRVCEHRTDILLPLATAEEAILRMPDPREYKKIQNVSLYTRGIGQHGENGGELIPWDKVAELGPINAYRGLCSFRIYPWGEMQRFMRSVSLRYQCICAEHLGVMPRALFCPPIGDMQLGNMMPYGMVTGKTVLSWHKVGTLINIDRSLPNTIEEYHLRVEITARERAHESRYNSEQDWYGQLQSVRRDGDAWWDIYNLYLRSPEWKAKREEVKARARNRCEICGRTPGYGWKPRGYQVHHETYVRAGAELLSDLLYLCGRCHDREDERRRR
jgi:hypothetical protein